MDNTQPPEGKVPRQETERDVLLFMLLQNLELIAHAGEAEAPGLVGMGEAIADKLLAHGWLTREEVAGVYADMRQMVATNYPSLRDWCETLQPD